jgi:hypothetical protein
MDSPSQRVHELEEAISKFITSFELVFDNDWEMTKNCITNDILICDNGTFIHPDVNDESNNWSNRGGLLDTYRHLLDVMDKNSIPHSNFFDS